MHLEADPGEYFRTPRLLTRKFVPTDLKTFVAYRADPEVAQYQGWSDYTLDDGRALIDSMRDRRPGTPGEWYQFALQELEGRALVGDVALKVSEAEPSEAELGVTLAPQCQGNGYGSEAVTGLLSYSFQTLGLRRVVAVTDARNAAAVRLFDRVKMRREAHFHENAFFKESWCSEILFAILGREWLSRAG